MQQKAFFVRCNRWLRHCFHSTAAFTTPFSFHHSSKSYSVTEPSRFDRHVDIIIGPLRKKYLAIIIADTDRRATLCTADPRESTFLYRRISNQIYLPAQNIKEKQLKNIRLTQKKSTPYRLWMLAGLKGRETALTWALSPVISVKQASKQDSLIKTVSNA